MSELRNNASELTGQCLIAMPTMGDPRFDHAVIYLCAHSEDGAMGLVINQELDVMTFPELLDQLSIPSNGHCDRTAIHFGGPVEEGRGFVLHSTDYQNASTMIVDEAQGVGLTADLDILRAMALGKGPKHYLMALGYAGWAKGQLDEEILDNAWLTAPVDKELIFSANAAGKWAGAVGRLGIDPGMLSETAGKA